MIIEHVAKTLGGYELVTLSVASRELRRMARIAGRAELRTETERLHALSEHMQRPTNTAASMQPLHLLQSCLKSINTELWADKTGWNWMFRASPSRRVENSASLVIETYDSSSVTLIDLGACPPLRVTIPYRGQAVTTRRTKSFELEDIVMKSFGLSPGWRALVVLTKREHSVHLLAFGSGTPHKSLLVDAVNLPTAKRAAQVTQLKWTDEDLQTKWKLVTTPGFTSLAPNAGEWALLCGLYCLSTTSSSATTSLMELQFAFASKGSSNVRQGRALFNGPLHGGDVSCVPLQLSTEADATDGEDGYGWYIRFEWSASAPDEESLQPHRIVQLALVHLLQATAAGGLVDLTAKSPGTSPLLCGPAAATTSSPIQQPVHNGQLLHLQPKGSHHVSPDEKCLFTFSTMAAEPLCHLSIRRRDDISQPWPLKPSSTGLEINKRRTIVSSSASRLVLINSACTYLQVLSPEEPESGRLVRINAQHPVEPKVRGDLIVISRPLSGHVVFLANVRLHSLSHESLAPEERSIDGRKIDLVRTIKAKVSAAVSAPLTAVYLRSRCSSSTSPAGRSDRPMTLWVGSSQPYMAKVEQIAFLSDAPYCTLTYEPIFRESLDESFQIIVEPRPIQGGRAPLVQQVEWSELAKSSDCRSECLLFDVRMRAGALPRREACLYLLAPISTVRPYWYRLSFADISYERSFAVESSSEYCWQLGKGEEHRNTPNFLCWSQSPFAIYLGALRALLRLLAEDD